MNALTFHHNLDFVPVMRVLEGEYTIKWKDAKAAVVSCDCLVIDKDKEHIRCILYSDCPAESICEEKSANKEVA